jgi:hypothetical protein
MYEPGAEALAAAVAASLPEAIEAVQARQYRPFVLPVTVYVCATMDSFASYTGSKNAGGHVLNRRLFISPKPENTTERVPRVLTHELSHLQIAQQISLLRAAYLPQRAIPSCRSHRAAWSSGKRQVATASRPTSSIEKRPCSSPT